MPRITAPGKKREPLVGVRNKARNKATVIKGKTKQHVGKATGNRRLTREGRADVVTGSLKNFGERIRAALRH
jgi:uncharacterized protein YjbJ (UPF0337 family)